MEQMIATGEHSDTAEKVAILLHGRGADAQSILGLKDQLNLEGFSLLAPKATNHTWYPYSFMASEEENEPYLSRSLEKIGKLIQELLENGKNLSQIFLIGFSQGACLSLEYAGKNPGDYGGIIAFTGGLIGENIKPEKYRGTFPGTPVFIGASERDIHVPLARINGSGELLKKMGAEVKTLTFKDTLHTIRKEEFDWVNQNILV